MSVDQGAYLITGVANDASIAWAVTLALLEARSRCILCVLPRNVRRAEKLVARSGYSAEVLPLDVRDEAALSALGATLAARGESLDGVLHAIAYAPMEDLQGMVFESSRAGFLETIDVSVYSLLALVRLSRPLLKAGASVVALSYHGSQKCMPGYGLMGIAKAGLESACRYLAYELGGAGIRVNCVSPGPLLTLSSSAFSDIDAKIAQSGAINPLRHPTRMPDVADAIAYMLSPRSGGITGQCICVDNGQSILGS